MYDKLDEFDVILLGRKTYELFVAFWPTATTKEEIIADKLNAKQKVVFSRTLDRVEWGKWENARLAEGSPDEVIKRLKQEPGKDMVIFGSVRLAQSFMNLGLIDEYWLFVTPIVLNSGNPLFKDIKEANGFLQNTLVPMMTFHFSIVWIR